MDHTSLRKSSRLYILVFEMFPRLRVLTAGLLMLLLLLLCVFSHPRERSSVGMVRIMILQSSKGSKDVSSYVRPVNKGIRGGH
jgi:hypothetical protein